MAIVIQGFKADPCEECGMNPVHHGLEKLSATLDVTMSRLFRPISFSARIILPPLESGVDNFGPLVIEGLCKAGLALKVTDLDPLSAESTIALWNEAQKRNIDIYEARLLGLPRNLFIARHQKRSCLFQGLPRRARWQPALFWMDDKAEMKRKFIKAGFPVAKGGVARTISQAIKVFNGLQPPVIVKPHEGSGGRHTAVNIQTEKQLEKAFKNAKKISPWVIIEEQLSGPVFRATWINGKLAGVLRRDPPLVIGDGVLTIRELVDKENQNPLRRGPVFADIKIDSKASQEELERQGVTPNNVPKEGQRVYFNFKVNWGVGGTSRDATDETHPDNSKLFTDIGEYLKQDIVGIDFMIEDISKSWKEQNRCGVIECNSLPHLGNHHFPYTGPVKNVAGAVWDMIFPESDPTRIEKPR